MIVFVTDSNEKGKFIMRFSPKSTCRIFLICEVDWNFINWDIGAFKSGYGVQLHRRSFLVLYPLILTYLACCVFNPISQGRRADECARILSMSVRQCRLRKD